jgi:tripartite-type tricarboxylate transporter receptor subunit TctC
MAEAVVEDDVTGPRQRPPAPAWRRAVAIFAILLASLAVSRADTYPSRPVTILTPFGAGRATDAAARLIGQLLQEALGQTFVIENKPGAGGLIAASTVARAQPDGYTLLLTTNSTHSAAASLFKNVPYDPITDFAPIARVGSFPAFFAANPNAPFVSMEELVAYAKANPGKLVYGHGNSTGQIVGETLKHRLRLDIVRVAYRSTPAAVTDLIAGHIPLMVADLSTGLPQVREKRMRPLAMLTKRRNSALPDVPTLDETVLPGFDLLAWLGLFAPAKTPAPVIDRLANEIHKILSTPELRKRFADAGTEVFWSGTAEFDDFVKTELVKWTSVIKEAGIEPE